MVLRSLSGLPYSPSKSNRGRVLRWLPEGDDPSLFGVAGLAFLGETGTKIMSSLAAFRTQLHHECGGPLGVLGGEHGDMGPAMVITPAM